EFTRKDYGNCFISIHFRIINSITDSVDFHTGTELDDVKRLVKGGRSNSVSPTRSSASSTLPVPRKATVEAKIVTQASQSVSGQYETTTLDSGLPSSYCWTSSTLPISSATCNSSSAYGYHSNTNNMSPGLGSSLLNTTSPSSLSGETTNETGYGVQKNISNGGGLVSTGVSTSAMSALRSHTDDAYRKDLKYLVLQKENVPVKRDTEVLTLTKDSGKHFTSSVRSVGGSLSGDSLKKEKMVSMAARTAPALPAAPGPALRAHCPGSVMFRDKSFP
uniref:Uncharacterized protein n=1 Tax=Oncorhynchus kisutch TaxID=8019 RepID=A0A8C7KXE5_ONCKI